MQKKVKSKSGQKGLSDLVGIDFSTTATKVVRLKKNRAGELSLMGMELLPPVDFSQASKSMALPKSLTTYYASLSYSGLDAVARIINAPLPNDSDVLSENKLRELLNVGDEYRVSAFIAKKGKGRQDSSFMAVAIPHDDARFLLNMFSAGPPAPVSIEVSGLAIISAFLHARGEESADKSICLIEVGEEVSFFAFMNKGMILLAGKYDFGGHKLRNKIVAELGVDDELAGTILADQSINVSSTVEEEMNPFLKQLSISKDFVERHQGCRISAVYVSGGVSLLPGWTHVVSEGLKVAVTPWSPLENISYEPDLIPENLRGQETRFAAAIGSVIGGLEES